MLRNYRNSDNIKEISNILKNSANANDSFIWQNLDGKRFIFSLANIELNKKFMCFSAKVLGDKMPSYDPSVVTYCKLDYKDTVFKVLIINIVENTIIFNLPEEVQTLELRAQPRQKFKPSDARYVTISVGVQLMAGASQALKYQLVDISKNGISIVVSPKNIKYFEDGITFKLTTLMDHELLHKLDMQLIYFRPIKYRQKGKIVSGFRVGLKIYQSLTDLDLQRFL